MPKQPQSRKKAHRLVIKRMRQLETALQKWQTGRRKYPKTKATLCIQRKLVYILAAYHYLYASQDDDAYGKY